MKPANAKWPTKDMNEKEYWRSLDQLADKKEFRELALREFPEGAVDGLRSPLSRRSFMSLMGASFALAGMTGCRRPVETILPYTRAPEQGVIGLPSFYATTMGLGQSALGLLVESHEGRPTKIEGNPRHPASLGATNVFAQAAILELYDPDRSLAPVVGGRAYAEGERRAGYAAVERELRDLRERWLRAEGQGLAVLSGALISPTLLRLRGELGKVMPKARWLCYEPVNDDQVRAGSRLAFGEDLHTHLQLEAADVIVALDADILGQSPDAVRDARAFAARRRIEKDDPASKMNRLYAVESAWSITGASADHRLRVRPSQVLLVAQKLATEIAKLGVELPAGLAASPQGLDERFISAMARDLVKHRGRAVIAVGAGQPKEVHALAHALNAALGAVGSTLRYTKQPDGGRPLMVDSLRELAAALDQGAVDSVLVLSGNPAYDAPADLGLAEKLSGKVIHLGLYRDETAAIARTHIPRAHFLESWGDAEATDGTLSVVQPLIAPLNDGWSEIEVVGLLVSGKRRAGYDLVRETWRARIVGDTPAAAGPPKPDGEKAAAPPPGQEGKPGAVAAAPQPGPLEILFETSWRRVLKEGLLAGSAHAQATPVLRPQAVAEALAAQKPAADGFEVHFQVDSSVYDGRFANNGWLQELPDPITKLTWDNAALLSPRSAAELGIEKDEMIEISVRGRSVQAAAFIQPGQADGTLTLALGYGRRVTGRVGTGAGFSAYALRDSRAMGFDTGASVKKTGRMYDDPRDRNFLDLVKLTGLVTTQDHFSLSDGVNAEPRPLVREASLEHFRKEPDFAKHAVHHPPLKTLYGEKAPLGQQWGMAIDLSACIGCNACVIACQSENNIPIVGKAQVRKGREMHWIRIDRYFSGSTSDPEAVSQPVPCMQCENAPCENVCPVAATVHSEDGLNDMAYNRCVGTRYCMNNCPYKVRRFNYLDWRGDVGEIEKLKYNPEVTLRSRGVMEKCTYCVQRIRNAQREAKLRGMESVADGSFTTACAQACPAEAIVFGDITDPKSKVSRVKASERDYAMLAELATKPRTTYLARIKNPNPELASHG